MATKKDAILIITEKPQAANKIAAALSNGKDQKITNKDKVSYYEFTRNGKRYLVGCAVGHLYGIGQIAKRGPFPNFEVEWKPSFERKGAAFTKKYLTVLKKLSAMSKEYIIATDYDVEGEVIGWNVLRFIGKQKDAKRMKYSSLTKETLEKSFQELQPHINWGAAIAGETRHYLDWFYGINLSRGLMKALSKAGQFRILSIGRVQGPALKIVVDKEKEIQQFKPEPYWQIFLKIKDIKGQTTEVQHPKDIFNKSELLKFKHLKEKKGTAKTTIKEKKLPAPKPFDLTTLQTESYKHLYLTPAQTLRIAQKLYLDGVISYPRTSSQQYPKEIGYENILKKIKKYTTLTKYATNKKPTQGKKTDPAHPAIYPTGEQKKLTEQEKKLYDLIVKRFIACFAKPAIIENKKINVTINGISFTNKGLTIKEKGWMNVYPDKTKEKNIPTINGEVDIKEIRTEEKETKPPRRYTAASLIKELEKRNLGTKATRSNIVETLYSRGYVKEKSLHVTELGMRMEETLNKYSPIILNEELTSTMDKELETIEEEKQKQKLKTLSKNVLNKAKTNVTKIAKEMTTHIDGMGKSLADANAKVWEEEKEQNTMNTCTKCNKGKLRVMYGKRYSRFFVSCDAYPKCKTIYSLPPKGLMKPARLTKKQAENYNEKKQEKNRKELKKEGDLEQCQECNYPLIISLQKGKAPWKICFNPKCPTNEEIQKKKEEFKKKLKSGEIEIDKEGKIIDHTKKKKTTKKKKKAKKKES